MHATFSDLSIGKIILTEHSFHSIPQSNFLGTKMFDMVLWCCYF